MVRSKLYSPSDLKIPPVSSPMTVKRWQPRSQTDKKVVKVLYDRVCMAFEKVCMFHLQRRLPQSLNLSFKRKNLQTSCAKIGVKERMAKTKTDEAWKTDSLQMKAYCQFFLQNFLQYRSIFPHTDLYLLIFICLRRKKSV